MGNFLNPLARAEGNILVAKDGSVWASYLLTGINISPYNPATLLDGQKQNELLFSALSQMDSTDILLSGIKTRTDPDVLAGRVVQGLRQGTTEEYPDLLEQISLFHERCKRGEYTEFQRVYVLSVKIFTGFSAGKTAFAKAGAVNPLEGVDFAKVRKQESEIFGLIPNAFLPARTTPEHLIWLHERTRTRGLSVPFLPTSAQQQPFNAKGFSSVLIKKTADTDVVLDEFIEATAQGRTQKARKSRFGQFTRNYASTRYGQALAVHSPEQRTDAMPDGPSALQSMMAVAGYPTRDTTTINTFTYLVDQAIGVDADFALRMNFSQEVIGVDHLRRFGKTLSTEAAANVTDHYDEEGYQDRRIEAKKMHNAVRDEPGPRGLQIAAIFAFADPNRKRLTSAMRSIRQHFEGNQFRIVHPVGGQFDLLTQMLPGVPCSELVTELKATTTVRKFSACMPLRRTTVGDAVGIPIAINKENALGQIVLMDLLNATDKGNASLALAAGQGGGKSMMMKAILGWMHDLKRPSYVIDPSPHGEYQVYCSQLGQVQVIDVLSGRVSLDPLKVFADDPELAQQVFLEVMLPLLDLDPHSAQALLLSEAVSPKNRAGRNINSTRDLIDLLATGTMGANESAEPLLRRLQLWAGQRYTKALFDPIRDTGHVERLDGFRPNHQVPTVVFRTAGLPVYKGELREGIPMNKRYSQVMYTLIARITLHHFTQYRGICGLFADELSVLDGSTVLEDLIKTPDRGGRKEGNFVVVANQDARGYDGENFAMIKKKMILKQDTKANASAAFNWADIPATDRLMNRMLTDTTPFDKNNNNMPVAGREGEGWYNDGFGNIARIQTIPVISERRRRYADTTSSKMIRASDLVKTV